MLKAKIDLRWFELRSRDEFLPYAAPVHKRGARLSVRQIGRKADLHALAPEGRKTSMFFVKPTLNQAVSLATHQSKSKLTA